MTARYDDRMGERGDLVDAISLQHLSRRFGSRMAVDDLTLQVHRGEVFGFLGPNGAGKTTTVRMMLGLLRPSGGTVATFGIPVTAGPRRVLPRVGAMIERPALYPYLSGRNNLAALADAIGGVPRTHLDDVIGLVGLGDRQHDRVSRYSLGMKQRLGIAMALLNEPGLLILDEPANGLDPAGVVEMRELLRQQAAKGVTVFITSHVLAEVERVCDRVAIIDRGRLLRVGAVSELTRAGDDFLVTVEQPEVVLALVRQQPWGREARIENGVLVVGSPDGQGSGLTRFLAGAGHPPESIERRQLQLEDVFFALTGSRR
jgi:ABC-2 type transport system ATP-binding protein